MNTVLALVTRENLIREIPNHLIHIHVEAGVAAALPEVERELLIKRAVERPVSGLHDRVRDLGIERSGLGVRTGRGLLDPRHRAEDIRIENDRQSRGA